ncbi:MAG: signal peptidase I [Candidatus Nanopelagicales bacterium]
MEERKPREREWFAEFAGPVTTSERFLPDVKGFPRRRRRSRVTKWVNRMVLAMMALVGLAIVWPASMGGFFGLTIVVGESMEPTYYTGDLVVTHKDDDAAYQVGDIVVYDVNYEGIGGRVVHRISEVAPGGTFTTRGDNNPYPDPWPVAPGDILGKVSMHVPYAGHVIAFARSPIALILLSGGIVTWILWPRAADFVDLTEPRDPAGGGPDPDDDAAAESDPDAEPEVAADLRVAPESDESPVSDAVGLRESDRRRRFRLRRRSARS